MKNYPVNKAVDAARLTDELAAAGVDMSGLATVRSFGGTSGLVVANDSAIDDTVNAVIAAHDGSQTTTLHALATAAATSSLAPAVALRAVLLVAVDEINSLREWITAFQAATAAATSLANLQTRIAALPALPDRTAAQAKTAIANKIAGGQAD